MSKFKSFLSKLGGPKKEKTVVTKKKVAIPGLFYLTDHLIVCPFPDEEWIEEIANYLNQEHAYHYIVYNFSEHTYDTSYFDNTVRIFKT